MSHPLDPFSLAGSPWAGGAFPLATILEEALHPYRIHDFNNYLRNIKEHG